MFLSETTKTKTNLKQNSIWNNGFQDTEHK